MSRFPTFNLTDKQIRGIANIVLHEQGTVAGWFAEASQIANLAELRYDRDPVRAVCSGWYAHGKTRYSTGTSNKTVIDIVKRVLCDGFRTLPRYIDEHDCMSDIKSAKNGSQDVKGTKSKWKAHETVVKNNMGSTYIFYCFPGGEHTGVDPFGYTSKSNRKKYGDFCYTVKQAQEGEVKTPKETQVKKGYAGKFPCLPPRGYYKWGDGYLQLRGYNTQVKRVQKLVMWITGTKLTVDGDYGNRTIEAVKKAQGILKVKRDGHFGPDTLAKARVYKK